MAAILTTVLAVGVVLTVWPSARAASDGTYRDGFPAGTYSGSSGTLDWSGTPWVEIGESDGPTAGFVRLETIRCSSGSCLWFDDDNPGTVIGAHRSADLSDAGSAVLTLSYFEEQDFSTTTTEFYVDVASSPGGPWTTLHTIVVDGTDTEPHPVAFDISPWISSTTTIRIQSNGADTDNEIYVDDVQIEATPAGASDPTMWFSLRDDTSSGPAGLPVLDDGAIASFDAPGINYEPGVTSGTLGVEADWDAAFATDVDISGLHLVRTDLTVGGIALQPGDLLFTMDGDETLPGPSGSITFRNADLGRFRPTTVGDYTAGTFSILLDSPLGSELRGVTLVEQQTRVGEAILDAGDILLIRAGGSEHSDVYRYVASSAGEGTTTGTTTKLLEGDDIGFGDQIWGLELVEDGMGWPFPSGAIVLSIEKDVFIGVDSVAVPRRTLVSLVVGRTSLSGSTTRVSAVLAWDGNDLGFDEDKERIDGFTFVDFNHPPSFDQDIGDRTDAEGDTVSFSASATDPLGDTLTYSASGLPQGMTIDSVTGQVSGTIGYDAAASSPHAVTLTVTDPRGNTDTDTFTWTVTDVNRAPTLAAIGDRTDAEGAAVSFAPVGNDADGDTITWSATGLPTGLSIDTTSGLISGTVDYTVAASSPYAVTVRVTDDGSPSLSTEQSFTWTITDTNRPPALVSPGDQLNTEADAVSVGVDASDPDGDTVTFQAFGLPGGLAIDPATGVISGTIGYDAAASSPFSVLIRATDDGSPSERAEVEITWTVTDTNRPPVVSNPGNQSDAEGDTVSLVVGGSDPDGDGLTWSATGLPVGLSIDSGTGVISGTIGYTAEGIHPVFVRATDDGLPSQYDEVSFTWTVANNNRAPVVTHPGDQANGENDAVSLPLDGSDPDGDGLTWTASGLPGGLSIDSGSGLISGTIDFDSAPGSPYSVTVRATDDDPAAMFDEVTFSWTVTDTNRPPAVTNPGDLSHFEGDPVAFAIAGSDPDGNEITWSASGLPQGLSIEPVSGTISGVIGFDAAASSPHAVTVRATDDGTPSEFDEVAFTWTVADTNRAPVVVSPGDQSDDEAESVSLAMVATDPDGDDLTWAATGLPGGLSIDSASGVISGTLSYESAGSHTVTVRASDDGTPSRFDEVSFVWTVADVNRPPVVSPVADRTDAEGSTVTQAVSGTDPDGDTITWSATGLPPGVSIAPSTGVISGTPTFTSSGTHGVTVRATDDGTPALFSEVAFTWTITNTNRAPLVTNPGPQSGAEASPVTLNVSGSDPDGNTLTWSATGLPPGLSIAPSTGQITGTPTFSSAGTHSVTVRATDDGSPVLFTEVAFSWTIANTNRAPVVIDPGQQATSEGSSPSLQIQASDPDGNLFGFEADGLPPGLTIHPQTGLITGDLGYDLALSYQVTVSVTDFGSPPLSTQVTFTWSIGEVNRPPVLEALSDRSGEQFTSVAIRARATDPDDDTLVFGASGLPGGVSIDASSGLISGAPTQSGSFTVTVTVTDTGEPALSDEDSFSWTVVSPPGFPVVGSVENQRSLTGDAVSLQPEGSHPDGLAIEWAATGLPNGLVIDPYSGEITGVLTKAGKWDVVVQLIDERDQAVAASFSWLVQDPDLPPAASDDTVRAALDQLVGGSVAIDVIGNDRDPEGADLTLVSAGPAEFGVVRIVDGLVLFDPPNGWLGTVAFPYVVADPAGNEATATVTVTIEEALGTRIAAAALQWDPAAPPTPDPSLLSIDPGVGTDLILGSVFQSLYVLRVPLALLGGAVFWSLLLGGILNLGFVLKGGVPSFVRRSSRNVAVVMAGHGQRVDVLDSPGDGMPIWRLTATERGLKATGRRTHRPDGVWAEIKSPNGTGWVPLANLTEEVDRGSFADDPEPIAMVREFVARLRSRRDISDLVSSHGLAVAHHGPLLRFTSDEVRRLMDDSTEYLWKGRNPAYPDQRATFDFAVATGILDAWDHPQRELVHDSPTVPATVMPVEFTNFHMVSIGADVHGPERLDQSAWIVVFTHEGGRPRIAGLVKEG